MKILVLLFLCAFSTLGAYADTSCSATIGEVENIPLTLKNDGMGPLLQVTQDGVSISVEADNKMAGTKNQPLLKIRISGPISLSTHAAPGVTGMRDGKWTHYEYRLSVFPNGQEISLVCIP